MAIVTGWHQQVSAFLVTSPRAQNKLSLSAQNSCVKKYYLGNTNNSLNYFIKTINCYLWLRGKWNIINRKFIFSDLAIFNSRDLPGMHFKLVPHFFLNLDNKIITIFVCRTDWVWTIPIEILCREIIILSAAVLSMQHCRPLQIVFSASCCYLCLLCKEWEPGSAVCSAI